MIETSVQQPGYAQAGGLRIGLAAAARFSAVGQASGFMAMKTARADSLGASIHTWKARQKVLDTGPHSPAHLPGEKPGGRAS
jgi:hypothetical protein